MLYNMPQKGTTVSLYMPNHDEREAIIINSIRQNTSQDMTDPSKRTFTTEHGKKLDLYKDQMKLKSKTTGTKVGLADEDTIFIKSHKNIDIKAKEEILLKAKAIKIEAKEELNLIKGNYTVESSITQGTEIDKKAKTQTKATGTVKESYTQIQDAPPEEKFDGAKVFTNVVAGLAVVGLVTIATAAIVVATGGSAAIIAGAALGGTISVGMTALFDKINNRVSSISEYMFNGFTGAVTGAISGGIDNAKKLGEGAKLAREALLGLGIGTGEDAARQVLLEGKKEVDPIRSVINGIMNAGLAVAVPLIIKGGKAVVNKIKTPGVNTVAGEAVEEVAEKGAKSVGNNVDEVISEGAVEADLGNKLDYLFGKASGNKHNIERSKAMQLELQKIGIHYNQSGNEYISNHLNNVLKDSTNISNIEIRSYVAKELPGNPIVEYTATTRESLLMGPGGAIMIESVWDGNRLLTVIVKGGK